MCVLCGFLKMTIICSKENVDCLRKQASNCNTVLNSFKWLIDSFILDFFTENHWTKLPTSWASALDSISIEEFGLWISDSGKETPLVLPLSLLALKAFKKHWSLERKSVDNLSDTIQYFEQQMFKIDTSVKMQTNLCNDGNMTEEQIKIGHIFRKHVKPKKQHELKRLGRTCAITSQIVDCDTVLDAGAGVGHLSRVLSYTHGLNVICVESQEDFSTSAKKIDLQIEEACSKVGLQHNSTLEHITFTLEPNEKNLTEFLNAHCKSNQKFETFGLIGLHTCGDLGPTLIQNFVNLPEAKFILLIGCCYMKINLERCYFKGFPMSSCVQSFGSSFASYEAFEVACHALESYCDRLIDSGSEKLKIHCYRATLEVLLMNLDPPLRRAGLRSVKNAHLMPFEDYAIKAVEKMNIVLDPTSLKSTHVQSCLNQWKRVVFFYSLRLLLAPLIETVIQLDRLLFLNEQGWNGCLIPLFDCRLSPRNYALLCAKNS